MRVGAAITLLDQAVVNLRSGSTIESLVLPMLGGAAGILLLAGLFTPIAAGVVAAIELWNAFSQSHDPWLYIALAILAVGLALVGPGAWSVDARLFGWKRIGIPDRRS